MLFLGPVAVLGDQTGWLSEALCFACSGLALIPCAERLSFVTEQVAEHTNGTIGALLNATFGNAPELLISVAALRAGYYRVVQLAMLGSILTNLLLVFGVACLIGGCRWQVQELRITSGNVHVVMLLVATAGCLFPAALRLAGQYRLHPGSRDSASSNPPRAIMMVNTNTEDLEDDDFVTPAELAFCRVNAVVMLILYFCFLLFQLKTHKDEYDNDTEDHSRRPSAKVGVGRRQNGIGQGQRHRRGQYTSGARRNWVCNAWFQQLRNLLLVTVQSAPRRLRLVVTSFHHYRYYDNNNGNTNLKAKVASILNQKHPEGQEDPSESGESDMRPLIHPSQQQHDCNDEIRTDFGGRCSLARSHDGLNSQDLNDGDDEYDEEGLDFSESSYHSDAKASSAAAGGGIIMTKRRRNKPNGLAPDNRSHGRPQSPRPKPQSQQQQLSPTAQHLSSPGRRSAFTSQEYVKSKNSDSALQDLENALVTNSKNHENDEALIKSQNHNKRKKQHDHDDCCCDYEDCDENEDETEEYDDDESHGHVHSVPSSAQSGTGGGAGPLMSMRVGIVWLLIITVCISAMSNILVDTIDGFARRLKLSEVFTSMVIVPFFSNVAEQVSAFLFAYRNEMDLCVGVTVGSAIQIATLVLPGSVVIGSFLNRSMTLYFHGYETVCLLFAVIVVGAILQGGTTNWMTGVMLVGIYVMMASGIWFHELENLTLDNERGGSSLSSHPEAFWGNYTPSTLLNNN